MNTIFKFKLILSIFCFHLPASCFEFTDIQLQSQDQWAYDNREEIKEMGRVRAEADNKRCYEMDRKIAKQMREKN